MSHIWRRVAKQAPHLHPSDRGVNDLEAYLLDLDESPLRYDYQAVKISTRSRYGLRALLELALHHGEGPLMMQSIADSQGVSRKYLDSIFASLKTAGMIRSRRGVGGGHQLAREPAQIQLGDVMRALEGPLSLVDCVGDPELCDRSHRCVTRDVWQEVGQAIEKVLDNITLADLVVKHHDLSGDLLADAEGCPLNDSQSKDSQEQGPS